ncbi:hypothetical protein DEU56DRAFT_872655 [Suillus clintonianus]|uniref:uncharacterized protein n=1 Tax=Suillus clintonianus TaxID=1904413 RepID=UPI001B862639|nr:uncharacterized protein DEU56DRAFT_872655 [Suillus clintonianus]KAG2128567.1 hypothetical protein DEU56DRAFT_872655 [Suillus clintonianus]
MPFRKISRDVKLAAINLYENYMLSLEQILDCVGFSESTFWRVRKLWRETGDVVRHTYGTAGRPRALHFDDIHYLVRLINHHPDWFLDELLDLLDQNRFISVHYTTIYRELARAGMSLKKLKKIARERNEDRRASFIRRMAQYKPEELGFIDETSKDERTTTRHFGRSMKGQPVVEGSFTTPKYKTFLEEEVVIAIVYPISGQAQCACDG